MVTNSLYARHFLETGHKFVNPVENFEVVRIERNIQQRKLHEQLEILKERKKGENRLMNIKNRFQ